MENKKEELWKIISLVGLKKQEIKSEIDVDVGKDVKRGVGSNE